MKKVVVLLTLVAAFSAASASSEDYNSHQGRIRRVLLISIDGMHAVDFPTAQTASAVRITATLLPAMAALGKTGVNYVAASTSSPSDSFPGLMAIVTGGSPRTDGHLLRCRVRPLSRRAGQDYGQWCRGRALHRRCDTDRHQDRV